MKFILFIILLMNQNLVAETKDHMIRFDCYQQKSDPSSPWLKTRIKIATNNAVKLKKSKLFLTTSEAVSHAEYCEWKVLNTNSIVPLKIAHVDPVLGLAILRADSALANSKKAIILGNDVKVNTKLDIYTLKGTNKPVRTSLRVKAVTLASTNQSYYNFRHLSFDSRSKNLGYSEAVFYKDKLVALADMRKDNKLFAIPSSVIKSYLNDYFSGKYKGAGLLGVLTGNLNSPYQKEYYNIGLKQSGEMIVKVSDDSSFKAKLLANDVILKIGNKELNSQGNYKHKLWGWMSYKDLLINYKAGDKLSLEVLRNGKKLTLSSVLGSYKPLKDAIVQDPFINRDYFIFAGLVFQELSIDYLKTWGREWLEKAPLTYLKKLLYDYDNFVTEKHVLILNTVLADKVNKGYESINDLVLSKVNGKPVTSVKELRDEIEGLAAKGEEFVVFEFEPYQYNIILDIKESEDSSERIIKRYDLGSDAKVFTH